MGLMYQKCFTPQGRVPRKLVPVTIHGGCMQSAYLTTHSEALPAYHPASMLLGVQLSIELVCCIGRSRALSAILPQQDV